MPQYGYEAPRMAFDSTIQIPTFCGVPTLKSVQFVTKKGAIAFDSCNNRFYTYNPKTLTWSQVSGGGGSTDTTSLSNRINFKLDSLKRRTDSVFAYRNGTEVFQFKDSVGGGGGSFLPLSGGTLTGNLNGTTATFSSNGSTNTFNINHTSGSGHGLEITKGGSGEGLIVNKTSGSGNAVTITGTLNATTIVKNGGTSSEFLKADGSVDATNYLIDTSSLSSRINLKFNTSDTSNLQQKSLPANSFMANNTASPSNPTATFFKDTSGSYTGTITWGGTAPTSLTATYRWVRIGRKVDLNITLVYANAGTSNTNLLLTMPSDAPTPAEPTGLTSNSNYLYPVLAKVNINATTLTNAAERGAIRKNSGGSGYEIFINFSSSGFSIAYITTTYWTN
jgi:hypothetical protein